MIIMAATTATSACVQHHLNSASVACRVMLLGARKRGVAPLQVAGCTAPVLRDPDNLPRCSAVELSHNICMLVGALLRIAVANLSECD